MNVGGSRSRLRTRLKDVAERGRETVFRRVPQLSAILLYVLRIRVADSATVLAAKAFTTFIPVLFVLAAFTPEAFKDRLKESLRSVLGLHGASLQQTTAPLEAPNDTSTRAFGLIGLVIVIVSATSCSRTLQKLIERCWNLPKATTKEVMWRWVVWLGGLVACLVVGGLLRDALGGPLISMVLTVPVGVAFWWWTQHFLLADRVGWLPLLPGAVLCGVSLEVWRLISRIYVPGLLDRSIRRYGSLGSVFAVLSWLLVVGFIVTVALAAGCLLVQLPPVNRWLRTPNETVLEPLGARRG